MDKFIVDCIESGAFPGAVLLIAKDGYVVYHKAFGFSMLIPDRQVMRLDTIFDLASITKSVVAAASTMILVERGLLRIDDPVCKFLPDFTGDGKDEVTIKHLLTHTSGLPAWKPFYTEASSREEIFNLALRTPLEQKPGEAVVYSDVGFIILTKIIEELCEARIDEFASKEIFMPLGMKDTMYNPPAELKERIAATEYCKFREKVIWGEVHDENAWRMSGVSGHAGLFSTASDLAVFAQMMLNLGAYGEVRILSPRSVKLMTMSHTSNLGEARGLGWDVKSGKASCGDLFSDKSFGHTGFTGTSLWVDPEAQMFVIFLTNRVHPTRENTAIIDVRPRLHNVIAASLVR
ncbi:MAG: penicillin-binding protein [Candidatus Methanomethylicota archaeon]|uniref:Penicillin-binding protein n=1 Tax=Thermoproteota archaeon TaxID=2056631 RepID=A0A497F660_9CREN|nr:MAG: penicillin-binding protein [Candidatus Verstraetearchaeota archaeon]